MPECSWGATVAPGGWTSSGLRGPHPGERARGPDSTCRDHWKLQKKCVHQSFGTWSCYLTTRHWRPKAIEIEIKINNTDAGVEMTGVEVDRSTNGDRVKRAKKKETNLKWSDRLGSLSTSSASFLKGDRYAELLNRTTNTQTKTVKSTSSGQGDEFVSWWSSRRVCFLLGAYRTVSFLVVSWITLGTQRLTPPHLYTFLSTRVLSSIVVVHTTNGSKKKNEADMHTVFCNPRGYTCQHAKNSTIQTRV